MKIPRIPRFSVLAFSSLTAFVACTPQQAAKDVTGGVGLGVCILNHIDEPPAQILKDCDGATQQMIGDITTAERAVEERHASRAKLLDGGK